MKSTFKIKVGNLEVDVKPIVFNGGEINVNLDTRLALYDHEVISVKANIADAEGIMTLALIKDAIDRLLDAKFVSLEMGYVPYARQDRVCNRGEALSIKVFCNMINAMEFQQVVILDPHSDVTPALLDNVVTLTPNSALIASSLTRKLFAKNMTLVAPDAGATKKVEKVAEHFGGLEVVQGIKKRDTKTGELSGFGFIGDVRGKDLLIVDDICDGGGTFIGLAEKLKEGGAKSISLYVSHGIFSKGLEPLLDTYFDMIYTTDSFNSGLSNPRLEIISWF